MGGGPPRPCIWLEGGWLLTVVPQHKHLGVWRRASGDLGREVAHRTAAGQAAYAALARKRLVNSKLLLRERVTIARARLHSRVLSQAGAWPVLSATLFKKIAVAVHRPLRVICGAHRPPLDTSSMKPMRPRAGSSPFAA